VLALEKLQGEVEVALLQSRVFQIRAIGTEGHIRVSGAGQVQPLINQMVLPELGQVGQQLLGTFKIMVNIAVHDFDAFLGLRGPPWR